MKVPPQINPSRNIDNQFVAVGCDVMNRFDQSTQAMSSNHKMQNGPEIPWGHSQI
ncbi:hypothetical protein TR2A62_0033 [Thalassobium sp. R2A62]|jgi:hypothetical protein|nr:hypothetical protein TR2A62_0033 [Thalassobium sp. R2A62]